jgi:hypothetical protein
MTPVCWECHHVNHHVHPCRHPIASFPEADALPVRSRSSDAFVTAGTNLTNLACDFGTIDPSDGLGLQIAALSDTDPTYAGSCGCVRVLQQNGLQASSCFAAQAHGFDPDMQPTGPKILLAVFVMRCKT